MIRKRDIHIIVIILNELENDQKSVKKYRFTISHSMKRDFLENNHRSTKLIELYVSFIEVMTKIFSFAFLLLSFIDRTMKVK